MHVKIFQFVLVLAILLYQWMVVHNIKKVCFMQYLIFCVKGVDSFYVISFDVIKFNFNCCFKFRFFRFNIDANSIYDTHILRLLFKGYGTWRNMIPFFSDFGWKLLSFFSALISSYRRSVSYFRLTSSSCCLSIFVSFLSIFVVFVKLV